MLYNHAKAKIEREWENERNLKRVCWRMYIPSKSNSDWWLTAITEPSVAASASGFRISQVTLLGDGRCRQMKQTSLKMDGGKL